MKFFPALCAGKISCSGRLGNKDDADGKVFEIFVLCDRPPKMVFDYQEFGLGVRKKLELLGGAELVIQGNQNAAAEEDGIRRDQPLGLIGHDDGGARAVLKVRILQSPCEGMRNFLELAVGEAKVLAFAIRFDQA